MYYSREQRIRKEAASQAINKTIQLTGERLDIVFPPGVTPSDSRDIMIEILSRLLEESRLP